MNDLDPKKTEDLAAPAAPKEDFRSNPDASTGVDRSEFVEAAEESLASAQPAGMDLLIESLQRPLRGSGERLQQEHVFHSEVERKRQNDLMVAGELLERVQLVLLHVDQYVQQTSAILTELQGSIRGIISSIRPIVQQGRQPTASETERIIAAAGVLRTLFKRLETEIAGSGNVSLRQKAIFGALEDLLTQAERPRGALRGKDRKSALKDEPVAVRIYAKIIEALKELLVGSEPEEQEQLSTVPIAQGLTEDLVRPDEPRPVQDGALLESDSGVVHQINGCIRDMESGKGIGKVIVFGGILGTCETDAAGRFSFKNVPHGHAYVIGPYKEGVQFSPPLMTGTLGDSLEVEFLAF